MIIDIEAKVELDRHELDAAQKLIHEFVERNKHITKIELWSIDVPRSNWGSFGAFDGVERVGMLVKVQAVGKHGINAVVKLLESLGANEEEPKADVNESLTRA